VTIDEDGIITCLIAIVRGDSGHTLCSGKGTSTSLEAYIIGTDSSVSESGGIYCFDVVSFISAREKKDEKDMRNKKNIRRFMVRLIKIVFRY